jgi:hypothetical protein
MEVSNLHSSRATHAFKFLTINTKLKIENHFVKKKKKTRKALFKLKTTTTKLQILA